VGYPEDQLAQGERLLAHQHPHPKMLVAPAAVFVLVCGVGGYLAALVGRASWWGVGWSVIAGVGLLLVLRFAVAPLARWLTTHFVLSDRRVLVREGVLRRVGMEIPLARIDGVGYRQGVLDRALGCGTLSVDSGSDAGPVEFVAIPRVRSVCEMLREAADLAD
jgi:membrane protein YdbS with pleckstrin-like domain